jgi:hypothetical protein
MTPLSDGWYRVSVTFTSGAGAATSSAGLQLLRTSNAANFYAFGFQYELGATATTYQKVTTTHDVTESGKRDCWGLLADGSDDSLITTSVDFSSTDKMTVMAAVRKLSDAAAMNVVESSTAFTSADGSFAMRAANSGADYYYGNRGSIAAQAVSSLFAAPTTNVVTGVGDIAGDETRLRVDGVSRSLTTSNLGSGNFGNHVIYLLRRAGTSNPFSGILYTLIIRGAVTPTATIENFEKNLLRIRAGLGPF